MKGILSRGLPLFLLMVVAGCKAPGTTVVESAEMQVKEIAPTGVRGVYPNATIFKMSGDYADNVAVSLNKDGSLAYFPAPGDLTEDSKPYPLANGWYLNQQGVGLNSVFTKWTFSEYMKLPAPPSLQEIKEAIIPGARVTALEEIPVPLGEAQNDPVICIKYAK